MVGVRKTFSQFSEVLRLVFPDGAQSEQSNLTTEVAKCFGHRLRFLRPFLHKISFTTFQISEIVYLVRHS